MKNAFIWNWILWFALMACSDNSPTIEQEPNPVNPTPGPIVSVEKQVTLNALKTYQIMDGFGASDCWSPAYVGKFWTSNRAGISELLFSKEIKAGKPKGIGLSMWRVNVGGGTLEQGNSSGIDDKSRRAESYLNDDLSYNWNKCEGQRYFLDRAKEFGCESIVLFSNTPPVQYTFNGKGYSNKGGVSNLKSEFYDDFAEYLTKVAEFYIGKGYPVTHISPVNEPQYNWDGGQEGSGWTNDEIARLTRELDASLTKSGLSTEILLGEAGDWEYLYKIKGDGNRSKVLDAFYNTSSSSYIGNLSHVKNLICAHSYWTDGTWDGMRNVRKQVATAANQWGVDVWQSEWSMLGDGYSSSEFKGYDAATEMDIALYMAKVIHNDLTLANVSSWSFWTSMDVARWGHKNRFLLISLLPKSGEYGDIAEEGTYTATPTLWVLGNYSLFIRPGYKRIDLSLSESKSFFGSAWVSPEGDKIVAVYSNLSEKGIRLREVHEGWNNEPKSVMTYTTSANKTLQENNLSNGEDIVLDAESVTTIIYNLK